MLWMSDSGHQTYPEDTNSSTMDYFKRTTQSFADGSSLPKMATGGILKEIRARPMGSVPAENEIKTRLLLSKADPLLLRVLCAGSHDTPFKMSYCKIVNG